MKSRTALGTVLAVVLGLVACSAPPKPGIYMGILRSADTPGREVTLFLLSDGSFREKTVFMDTTNPAMYGYGTYRIENRDVLMTYTNGSTYAYEWIGASLMDKAGPIPDDRRRGFGLLRISD